jgi:hypothetical protein
MAQGKNTGLGVLLAVVALCVISLVGGMIGCVADSYPHDDPNADNGWPHHEAAACAQIAYATAFCSTVVLITWLVAWVVIRPLD